MLCNVNNTWYQSLLQTPPIPPVCHPNALQTCMRHSKGLINHYINTSRQDIVLQVTTIQVSIFIWLQQHVHMFHTLNSVHDVYWIKLRLWNSQIKHSCVRIALQTFAPAHFWTMSQVFYLCTSFQSRYSVKDMSDWLQRPYIFLF